MRLFVNYAHNDKEAVMAVAALLREGGHEPWIEQLLTHQDWQAELIAAISGCDALVYALSPESVGTDWCQWAMAQAIKAGKPIVPFVVAGPVSVPAAVRTESMADFSVYSEGRAIARLLGALTRVEEYMIHPSSGPTAPVKPRGIPAQAMGTTIPHGMRSPSSGGMQATEE